MHVMLTRFSDRAKREGMRLIARALAAGRLETKVEGIEHIPRHGPVLLVARHYHHLFDGVALYQVVPREIHILVTLDWVTNRLVRVFMESAICLARWPLVLRAEAVTRRIDGTQNQKKTVFTEKDVSHYQRRALRDALNLLADGKALLIFPEGYPNIDPNFTPKKNHNDFLAFNSGFAVIAAAAAKRLGAVVPTVPVGLNYLQERRWIARLNFGAALYQRDYPSRKSFVAAVEQQVKQLSR
jgi:putative membrane protein